MRFVLSTKNPAIEPRISLSEALCKPVANNASGNLTTLNYADYRNSVANQRLVSPFANFFATSEQNLAFKGRNHFRNK